VSGGSITAGVLGLKWSTLVLDGGGVATNFETEIVRPLRTLAGKTIDEGSIIGGILLIHRGQDHGSRHNPASATRIPVHSERHWLT
jgi:NTE family protein